MDISTQERTVNDGTLTTGNVPAMTEAEKQRVLFEWNNTEAQYPNDRLIHQLFEEKARDKPDAIAAVFEGRHLTYRELNERANGLAHRLIELGVGPDVRVGMHFGRCLEAIVSILGILKAGGAYVALDAALPTERTRFMLEDAGVAAVVTKRELTDSLPRLSAPVISLDADESLTAGVTGNPQTVAQPHNLVYVMYTSGSTGRPKGVAVEHRQLLNYVYGLKERLGLPTGASYATVSTLSADLGNTVVFSSLAWGGCLHVIARERIFNGGALAEYFRKHQVDCLKITPSHLAALHSGSDPAGVMPRRWLVLGGEATMLDWLDSLVRSAPDCTIFNHYGPTETTVGVLTYRVTPDRPETNSNTLVLGRPLPNSKMYVVDKHLCPVPVGVAGELLVGGAGVARGYLNRPELTAERFISHPFGNGRVYRTGDRVRYLPDGNIEFLGRIDNQVKIRGYRIELGEVEQAISDHPAVETCVVVPHGDQPADKRLVAYAVGAKIDEHTLRGYLKRLLPDHMIPAAFVLLDRLPLNANGKVDRRALPEPDYESKQSVRHHVAPRGATEAWLAGVWHQLLGAEQISVEDSFFDLGGHSLLAVRLFTLIRKRFKVDLPLAALFGAPTISKLAAVIDGEHDGRRVTLLPVRPDGKPWEHLVAIQPHGSKPAVFCVCGIRGHVLNLQELSRELGPDQPFYGFQARGVNGLQHPFESVEEMAEAYIREMRMLQPNGPYFIAGHSAGGIVAFEIAHQLLAKGEDVPYLGVFDTFCPGLPSPVRPSVSSDGTSRSGRLQRHIRQLRKRRLQHVRHLAKGLYLLSRLRIKGYYERIQIIRRDLSVEARRALGIPLPFEDRERVITLAAFKAFRQYDTKVYPGSMTAFTVSIRPGGLEHYGRDLGWTPFVAGHLDICDLPGNHDTFIEQPHVRVLARELQKRLRRAQERVDLMEVR